jgi:hypothetical protein
LQQHRPTQAEIGGKRRQRGRTRERREHGIEIVQRMTDLVQCQRLGSGQPAAGIEGLVLEEEADAAARRQEIRIAGSVLPDRGKDRAHLLRIEAIDQLGRPRHQGVAGRGRGKPLDHQETVTVIAGAPVGRQHVRPHRTIDPQTIIRFCNNSSMGTSLGRLP